MKRLYLRNMWLLSEHEQAATHLPFHRRLTVITGANDTGKSSAIKCIYETFGATAATVNPKWREARASSLIEFDVDGEVGFVARSDGVYALYDADQRLRWRGARVTTELAPEIARMLDFNLELKNRQTEKMQAATPAYCFLPFYIDQDHSWSRTWSGFASLQMFSDYRQDAANFHSGIRPPAYYSAKGRLLDAEKQIDEASADKAALVRAGERLKGGRQHLHLDLRPEAFGDRVEALVAEAGTFSEAIGAIQSRLNRLNSERVTLAEQQRAADAALNELSKDVIFALASDDPLICPTCGTEHESSFLNRLGIMTDQESCRAFLRDAAEELADLDQRIAAERAKLSAAAARGATINAILDENRGEIKLRDILQGESERLVDEAFVVEGSVVDDRLARELLNKDQAQKEMKELSDKTRAAKILDFYRAQMKSALMTLDVRLDEAQYKGIEGNIKETGSDLPRALLAYYYSFLHTLEEFGASCACPVVVDSPVQQDQDDINAQKVIAYATSSAPKDMQVILATVSMHGVEIEGTVVELSAKNRLLQEAHYEDVRSFMKPFLDQIFDVPE